MRGLCDRGPAGHDTHIFGRQPPDDFVRAVLEGPLPGTDDCFARLRLCEPRLANYVEYRAGRIDRETLRRREGLDPGGPPAFRRCPGARDRAQHPACPGLRVRGRVLLVSGCRGRPLRRVRLE